MSRTGDKQRKQEAMKRVRAVQDILRRWDPIRVAPGEFAPADEYDDYAPHIVSSIAQGCSVEDLAGHLGRLRTVTIGVEADPEGDMTAAREIVEALRGGKA